MVFLALEVWLIDWDWGALSFRNSFPDEGEATQSGQCPCHLLFCCISLNHMLRPVPTGT